MKKQNGFTLAESATHTNMLQRVGNGFTLAEVLITLAIIGVVAAMTIPTLIAKINSIVTDNQQKVFNAKLIKGLNLTKTAGDLNNTYASTYDFLTNGLGKNLKMAKVCDKNNIRDCIPYDKIKYEDKSGNEKTINVADIKTVDKLNLKAPYMDPAAFVLADGTPVIVSYNKECIDDPDKADTTINACLAGIYDLNGSRKPNKYLAKVETINNKEIKTEVADLRGFNGAYIGRSCFGQIGDLCIANGIKGGSKSAYEEMLAEIRTKDTSYTMPKYRYWSIPHQQYFEGENYWQLGNDYCSKVQEKKVPTMAQLAEIANALYGTSFGADAELTQNLDWSANKDAVFAALGIMDNTSDFQMWASDGGGDEYNSYTWRFTSNFSQPLTGYPARLARILVICVDQ